MEDALKYKSNESDIKVYDIDEGYSIRTSSSTKPTDKREEKHISVPEQEHEVTGPTAHLGSFTGKVYDKLTFRRVEGALVTIVKNLSVKTDEKGEFFITNIKPGKYRVTVSEDGYVVQSRKSIAVAGVTTKLDSFHLIPDCLADDYPNEIEEEEETGEDYLVEEETIAPAVESIPPISAEEISCAPETVDAKIEEEEAIEIVLREVSEKTTRVSSEIVSVEDVDKEIVPDLETTETITEENPMECSETDAGEEALSALEETAAGYVAIAPVEEMKKTLSDEIVSMPAEEIQIPAIAADSAETAMSLPEEGDLTEVVMAVSEGTVVGDVSSVDELPHRSVETGVAEAVQREEVPQELSCKGNPIENTVADMVQKETKEKVQREEAPWSFL